MGHRTDNICECSCHNKYKELYYLCIPELPYHLINLPANVGSQHLAPMLSYLVFMVVYFLTSIQLLVKFYNILNSVQLVVLLKYLIEELGVFGELCCLFPPQQFSGGYGTEIAQEICNCRKGKCFRDMDISKMFIEC